VNYYIGFCITPLTPRVLVWRERVLDEVLYRSLYLNYIRVELGFAYLSLAVISIHFPIRVIALFPPVATRGGLRQTVSGSEVLIYTLKRLTFGCLYPKWPNIKLSLGDLPSEA
jgi:hypothetical protein